MQFVIARRWDQLGGRLCAITNACSFAELLGLEFRFVWPRGLDPAVNEPRHIFGRGFLESFELEPTALDGRPRVYHRGLAQATEDAALNALRSAGTDAFLEVDEFFGILAGAAETAEQAAARFRRCFAALGWSDEIGHVQEFCSGWPPSGSVAAIHVRAGDIVNGAWRHTAQHEKYTPTPYVHHAIEQLIAAGARSVLVVSDNEAYLAWLRRSFARVVTPAEVVPGYAGLTELQRALADILLLSRCAPIVGPPSSAFSLLAANLGASSVVRADTLVPSGSERQVLLDGIASRTRDARDEPLWLGLLARDICWYLDVFGDTLTLRERRRLADLAVGLEPEFCAALTHAARSAALAGRDRRARALARDAVAIAQSGRRSDDPLLDALATKIAVACFASIRRPRTWRSLVAGRVDGRGPAELAAELDRCLELDPIWLNRLRVFDALRFLIAAARSAAEQPLKTRLRLALRLRRTDPDELAPERFRASGLERHRTVSMFDPLSRELELLALRLHHGGVAHEPPRLVREPEV